VAALLRAAQPDCFGRACHCCCRLLLLLLLPGVTGRPRGQARAGSQPRASSLSACLPSSLHQPPFHPPPSRLPTNQAHEALARDAEFRTGILERRLKRHEEVALAKYHELDRRLKREPRLHMLVADR
jgi:hypothetical protein